MRSLFTCLTNTFQMVGAIVRWVLFCTHFINWVYLSSFKMFGEWPLIILLFIRSAILGDIISQAILKIFEPIPSRPVAFRVLIFWINSETWYGVINGILDIVSFNALLFI